MDGPNRRRFRAFDAGNWTRGLLASAITLALPAIAAAQQQPVISLAPPNPPAWDVAGHVSWFGSNKSAVAPEWDRWYSTGGGGIIVGRYWTPHIKTEVAGTVTRAGRMVVSEPVLIGSVMPVFIAREHTFQATTVAASAAYQFFENQWVHPFVGGGVEVVRERQRMDELRQPIPTRPVSPPAAIPPSRSTDAVRYSAQPFINAGVKLYVSQRAFVRTDVMSSFNTRGVSHVAWSGGIGVEL